MELSSSYTEKIPFVRKDRCAWSRIFKQEVSTSTVLTRTKVKGSKTVIYSLEWQKQNRFKKASSVGAGPKGLGLRRGREYRRV